MKLLKRYAVITLGCLLFAAGFAFFLDPADIAPGGVSGAAVILTHFYPSLDCGTVILLLNLPLLTAGALVFGGRFFFGTIWATVLSSLAVTVLEAAIPVPFPVDRWFCAVSGALFCGMGLGMVYRQNATTGGTDIAVRLLQRKYPETKPGVLFVLLDSVVVAAAGIVFRDFQTAYYSGVSLALSMAVFTAVLEPVKMLRKASPQPSR